MAIITLYDINETFTTDWARNNCPSFVGWMVYENDATTAWSWLDNEPEWWIRYEFEFLNEHDAMLFQLRWQGQ